MTEPRSPSPSSLGILIGRSLQDVGEGIEKYMNETDDKSAGVGSLAERDARLQQQTGTDPALASLPAAIGFVTLGVASDNLRAARPLIINDQGEVSVMRYAVFSVLRVAMEVSALVSWLVDERVTPRVRLMNALTLMEHSRSQRQRSEGRPGEDPSEPNDLDAIRHEVETMAQSLHLQKITRRLKDGRGLHIPNAVDLIGRQFRQASKQAEVDALALYGVMSEPMHGSILGAMLGFGQLSHSVGQRLPAVSVPDLVSAALYTGYGATDAMSAFVEYMGWDLMRWQETAQQPMENLEHVIEVAKVAPAG